MVDFFVVFRLFRVHLSDLSTYFIDILLLVEDALKSVLGCFFLAKSRLHYEFFFLTEGMFFYCYINFPYSALSRDWKKSPQIWHKFLKLRGFTTLCAHKRAQRTRQAHCARKRASSLTEFSCHWERLKKPVAGNSNKLPVSWNQIFAFILKLINRTAYS